MELSVDLWVEYLLRFSHLVAGIMWIGSSFYFVWLDSSFDPPEEPRRNVDGELFMVHGGFYYQVDKKKIYPGELPKILHWFKWEATLTLVTGYLLFIYLYYLNGASLLIDPSKVSFTQSQAVMMSVGLIAACWFLYDFIWHPKWMKSKTLSTFLSLVFFVGLVLVNNYLFSGRGAFIQTGVVMGTAMLLNVWIRILPGQSKMLRDAQDGKVPDYSIGLKSKTRSVHNTYFIFPVLFIMISNHYPIIYNHHLNWLLLILLSVSGALVRHVMVTKNPKERWLLVPAAVGFLALVYLTSKGPTIEVSKDNVTFQQVEAVFQQHCVSCHSSNNTDEIFKIAPKGVLFETEEQIRSVAEKIQQQVVTTKIMPFGNKTGMTDEERGIIGKWLIDEGLVQKP